MGEFSRNVNTLSYITDNRCNEESSIVLPRLGFVLPDIRLFFMVPILHNFPLWIVVGFVFPFRASL